LLSGGANDYVTKKMTPVVLDKHPIVHNYTSAQLPNWMSGYDKEMFWTIGNASKTHRPTVD
jgi:hypothetical protein